MALSQLNGVPLSELASAWMDSAVKQSPPVCILARMHQHPVAQFANELLMYLSSVKHASVALYSLVGLDPDGHRAGGRTRSIQSIVRAIEQVRNTSAHHPHTQMVLTECQRVLHEWLCNCSSATMFVTIIDTVTERCHIEDMVSKMDLSGMVCVVNSEIYDLERRTCDIIGKKTNCLVPHSLVFDARIVVAALSILKKSGLLQDELNDVFANGRYEVCMWRPKQHISVPAGVCIHRFQIWVNHSNLTIEPFDEWFWHVSPKAYAVK